MVHFYFFAAIVAVTTISLQNSQEQAPADTWKGKVVEVAATTVSIRNPKDGQNMVFVVNSATVITRNGKVAALSDVQLDDRAEIKGVKDGERFVAKTLTTLAPE